MTQLLASAAPAAAAVLLIMLSRRFLGGRKLADYGLAVDRRWMIDQAGMDTAIPATLTKPTSRP